MMRDFIEFFGGILAFIAAVIAGLCILIGVPVYAFGDRNVNDLNANAPRYLESLGFTVVGREGFTYGLLSQPGGCVWYTMTRKEQPATVYTGCVSKWHNGTYELWGPRAINAVSAH